MKLPTARDFIVYGREGGYATTSITLTTSNPPCIMNEDCAMLPSSGLYLESYNARSVSRVGDVNGDGFGDLGIGNPLADEVYVLFGSVGERRYGGEGEGLTIYGESRGDYLGWSIGGAGDFDGDGIGDVIVSAMVRGTVYLIFGRGRRGGSDNERGSWSNVYLSRLKVGEGLKVVGSSGSLTGIAVSSAGDFNGDGKGDVMFSAKSTVTGGLGGNVMYVLYGGNASMLGELSVSVESLSSVQKMEIESPSMSFAGMSLAGVGDVNGDGVDDIAIGSVPYQGGYATQVSYIVYGRRVLSSRVLKLDNMTRLDGLKVVGGGFMVSGAGDVDGDGVDDVLVSSYYDWGNEVGDYLVTMPLRNSVSRRPSMSPSAAPSTLIAAPSNRPSSEPSWSMDDPSSEPSSLSFQSLPFLSL